MHSTLAFLFLALTSSSLADFQVNPAQPRHESNEIAERTYFDFKSLGSLFSKRDDCGTQYGPTWVDCGFNGCYQPSLGQVCCADVSRYCDAGNYCQGLHCCANGIPPSCCGTGFGCPASDSSAPTSPASTTSSPAAASTSSKAAASTPSPTPTSPTPTPSPKTSNSSSAAVKGTTSVVGGTTQTSTSTKTSSSGLTSTVVPVAGAQKLMELDGSALAFLGVVGVFVGLM